MNPTGTRHRPGCASSRHRPCTCEYLNQWDHPAGPGILVMPEGWQNTIDHQVSARMPIILNNPEHRWIPGNQLPPRQTGR